MSPSTEDVRGSLQELGVTDCIVVKRRIHKDAVKRLPTKQVMQTGAYIKQTDEFGYEVDRTALSTPAE